MADSELWEDLIDVAKDILAAANNNLMSADDIISQRFICRHWTLKRVHLNHHDWHQLQPHVGKMKIPIQNGLL